MQDDWWLMPHDAWLMVTDCDYENDDESDDESGDESDDGSDDDSDDPVIL